MKLNCIKCSRSTAVHCFTDQCVWSVCIPCGLIYAPTGCIPTWDRYSKEQGIGKS